MRHYTHDDTQNPISVLTGTPIILINPDSTIFPDVYQQGGVPSFIQKRVIEHFYGDSADYRFENIDDVNANYISPSYLTYARLQSESIANFRNVWIAADKIPSYGDTGCTLLLYNVCPGLMLEPGLVDCRVNFDYLAISYRWLRTPSERFYSLFFPYSNYVVVNLAMFKIN